MLNNRRPQLCKNPVRGEGGGHNFHFLSGLVFFFKEAQKLCISFFRGADRKSTLKLFFYIGHRQKFRPSLGLWWGGGGGIVCRNEMELVKLVEVVIATTHLVILTHLEFPARKRVFS